MKLVTFLTFVVCLRLGKSTIISISDDGGYSNIVVAIDTEDEDVKILTALTELLTNASSFLYTATKGSVFFEQVTIVVPSSWSPKPEYSGTLKDYSKDGHILVSESEYSSMPSTVQPGDCGEPGKKIELPLDYLRNMNEINIVRAEGVPAKRFVQEWAKFRYGVFDESVSTTAAKENPRLKTYYMDGNDFRPATCTSEIGSMGLFRNPRTNDLCNPSEDKNCKFLLFDKDYVTQDASIMYSTAYDSIKSFCNETQHNKKAVNLQNIKCQFKSTWAVISSHEDFKAGVPSTIVPRDTVPKFRFLRTVKSSGKTVMVLDVSGSMEGVPISLLHRTTTRHVLHFAPEGSELGIVIFSSNAQIKKRMTTVTNATRAEIASALPSTTGGSTAIGRGLQTGLEVLQSSGIAEGGVILLITDAEENLKPHIDVVLPSIVNQGVIVNVIAYGDNASRKLENLAHTTGGTATIFRDISNKEANVEDLGYMIMEATATQADINLKSQKVKSERLLFGNPEELTLEVPLEEELGKNTVFSFRWTYDVVPDIQLVSPSGKRFDRYSDHCSNSNKHQEFKFETAETGTWRIVVIKQASESIDIQFTLTSTPADSKVQPLIVLSWLNGFEVDLGKSKTFVKGYAEVSKSKRPVVGAVVTGIFESPTGTIEIPLKDDGIGVDSTESDGIYSGALTDFTGNGRYLFRARVISGENAQIKKPNMRRGRIGKRSATKIEQNEDDEDFVLEPIRSKFERLSEGGTITVLNWKPNLGDIVKPARVVDLEVTDSSYIRGVRTVALSWTSAGDDFFIGNASHLDIRMSVNLDDLIEHFEEQWKVNESFVLAGNILPTEGGLPMVALLLVPDELFLKSVENQTISETQQVYVAMRYIDENNNEGDISNVVSALLIKDVTPPATIVDLELFNLTRDDAAMNFCLRWTVPGDNSWEGIANLLDLRISTQAEDIITNFAAQLRLNDSFILNGSLIPTEGGAENTVDLLIPRGLVQNATHLYLGLIYLDEEGNAGNVSNIVQLEINPLEYSNGETNERRMNRSTHTIIIGVIITIVFVLGILSGVFFFLKRGKEYKLVTVYSSNI